MHRQSAKLGVLNARLMLGSMNNAAKTIIPKYLSSCHEDNLPKVNFHIFHNTLIFV
jgi:hypothetical protein